MKYQLDATTIEVMEDEYEGEPVQKAVVTGKCMFSDFQFVMLFTESGKIRDVKNRNPPFGCKYYDKKAFKRCARLSQTLARPCPIVDLHIGEIRLQLIKHLSDNGFIDKERLKANNPTIYHSIYD